MDNCIFDLSRDRESLLAKVKTLSNIEHALLPFVALGPERWDFNPDNLSPNSHKILTEVYVPNEFEEIIKTMAKDDMNMAEMESIIFGVLIHAGLGFYYTNILDKLRKDA